MIRENVLPTKFINPVGETVGTMPTRSSLTPAGALVWPVRGVSSGIPINLASSIKSEKTKQIPLSPSATHLQIQLRSRWSSILKQSQELSKEQKDPVQSIVDLLGNLPGDYATWREIIEEPYG
jgi:hypothetical protein